MTVRPITRFARLAAVAFSFLAGCATTSPVVGFTPAGTPIVKIPLRLSNAYLIETRPPVLVDCGTYGDLDELQKGLHERGFVTNELGAVILTHGHGDHAGLAADLQLRSYAKVFLGEGDVPAARRGHNDEMNSNTFMGALAKPFVAKAFPEFTPDVVVREPINLDGFGIDGRVVPMPGHTPGSLVVVLSNHAAFVGDQMLGGALGGAIAPRSPGEHYYQADPAKNRENIRELLGMGVETFYLGHGGPVSRADVIAAFNL